MRFADVKYACPSAPNNHLCPISDQEIDERLLNIQFIDAQALDCIEHQQYATFVQTSGKLRDIQPKAAGKTDPTDRY